MDRLGSVMALLSGPAVADAIGDAKNGLFKLAAEPDEKKLIDELFLRVLNRPASTAELARSASTLSPETERRLASMARSTLRMSKRAWLVASVSACAAN